MREDVRQKLDDAVLYLFRELRYPVFPVDPSAIARRVDRCRYLTYDELARISVTTYEEIVRACRSLDGCTQYDPVVKRYLVVINTSHRHGASRARIRWTTAHELGHIAAGHFIELAEHGHETVSAAAFDEMEEEADYFAASLLAPIPALKTLRVKRPADIRDWFGLSQTAAEYRWADLLRIPPDERLEDYFHVFLPRSVVKDAKRMRGIDVAM